MTAKQYLGQVHTLRKKWQKLLLEYHLVCARYKMIAAASHIPPNPTEWQTEIESAKLAELKAFVEYLEFSEKVFEELEALPNSQARELLIAYYYSIPGRTLEDAVKEIGLTTQEWASKLHTKGIKIFAKAYGFSE